MTKTLLHPQEIEVYYIIPTIRRYIALLLKEKGMKQKDIAEILGINTATISQYTSTKRGHKIEFTDEVVEEIKKSVTLIQTQIDYVRETQRLLSFIKTSRSLCNIHKQLSNIPKDCEPCNIGCNGVCHGCN